jgi:hypothetical protein
MLASLTLLRAQAAVGHMHSTRASMLLVLNWPAACLHCFSFGIEGRMVRIALPFFCFYRRLSATVESRGTVELCVGTCTRARINASGIELAGCMSALF